MLPNGKLTEKKYQKECFMFFYWCRTIGIMYVNIKKNISMSTKQPKGEYYNIDCAETNCVLLIKYFRAI